MKKLCILLIMIIVVSLPLVSYGNSLSAFGTASIDGTMSIGEWDKAAKMDFLVNVPPSDGGGTVPATLYVMNDETNLYLALKFAASSFGISTQLYAYFDNNNDGIANDGEDVIALFINTPSPPSFVDIYRYTCTDSPAGSAGCFAEDKDAEGGILPADGAGAASNDGSVTFIELAHPLCSKDILHDFCLKPASTVGLRATLTLFGVTQARSTPPNVETTLPAQGTGVNYEQVTIASPIFKRTVIDIKPGSRVNSINRGSEGKIPVAIISDSTFNALTADRSSLTFGRTGDERSLAFCSASSEDVNGDGLPDLVCHFYTKLTGFQTGDNSGILKGSTTDGSIFTGVDSIRIVH